MKALRFFGCNDDSFCVDTPGETPLEVYCESMVGVAVIDSPSEGKLNVTAVYNPADNGCWSIGIAPNGPFGEMPEWPISYRQSRHTPVLTIEVPDDAEVSIPT